MIRFNGHVVRLRQRKEVRHSYQLLSNGLQVMFDAEEVSRLPAVLSGELLVSHVSSIWLTITLPGGALLWSDFSSHLGFLPGF